MKTRRNQMRTIRDTTYDSPRRRAAETDIGGAKTQNTEGKAIGNNRNRNMKRILKRMAVMTVVLVLLLSVLVACGGKKQWTSSLPSAENIKITMVPEYERDEAGNIVLDENGKPKQATDENGKLLYANKLSDSVLKNIALMLRKADAENYTVQSMLIASANGFGMAAVDSGVNAPDSYEDVNGNGVYDAGDKVVNIKIEDSAEKAIRLRLVRNFILEANLKASSSLLASDLEALGVQQNANGDYIGYDPAASGEAFMNEADVRSLIDCFKIQINSAANDGIIDSILLWIGKAVAWITDTLCFGSYLAGICVFAVIIEILMLPFAIKQQKNSIRQAKLRPKEMAIRNKYKGRNDKVTMQKMQQEIQEFYQKEHFSPYSGCISLVIQLPIIMALYSIIINPLHYMLGQSNTIVTALNTYAATPAVAGGAGMSVASNSGTISLLAEFGKNFDAKTTLSNFEFFSIEEGALNSLQNSFETLPDFNVFGINFGMAPSIGAFNILLLVPILTFAAYFITSKLNRKLMHQPAAMGADAQQVACSNSMMDITMPLMSTFFTFMVPALVGVYWIFRSLVGLLKQFIVSKVMPLPVFTEEDYKAAEREMKGKSTQHASNNANGKQVRAVRSLHYIDDEDFEDTRERGLARKAALEEKEREAQEKQEQKKSLFSAPMKETRENKKEESEKKTEDATEKKDTDDKTEE